MRKLITTNLLFCLTALACLAQTNEGTNFWFGFMEHVNPNTNTKVVMITSKQNTAGVVSIPGLNFSSTFTVQANQVIIIEMPSESEFLGSEFVRDIGINVSSNLPVSVYIHQYNSARSEATVVLPVESISSAYYVMCYSGIASSFVGDGFSEFLIVATEDETTINYTLSDNTQGGKTTGQSESITLDLGETYQVRGSLTTSDLTGTYIEGDKSFSLFAGASFSAVPRNCSSFDNLLEQMTPIDTWGTRFVSVPTNDGDYDVFRMLAAENATNINVYSPTGTNTLISLQAGEFFEYSSFDATYIESNNPIMVAQYLIGQSCTSPNDLQGDPSMLLLNSVEQIRDTVTLFNSGLQNIETQFINIICRTDDIDIVKLDGALIQSELGFAFTSVGPEAEFAYVRIQTSQGPHTITDPGCGVIASAYGFGERETYAYSGGASFSKINANQLPEGGCRGIDVAFSSGLPPERYSLEWDIGDGQAKRTDDNFTHTYNNLGTYPSQLIIYDKCFDESDTLTRDMIISLRQAVDAIAEIELCEDESINFEVTDSGIDVPAGARVSFEWSGPLDYFAEEQYPTLTAGKPEMSGTYKVIGIVSGCATFPDSTVIIVNPTPTHDLGENTTYCLKNDKIPILDGGNFDAYLWGNGSTDRYIDADEEGELTLVYTDDQGCIGSDSIFIIAQCPTQIYIPNVFSPDGNSGLQNENFGVLGEDIITFDLTILNRWGNIVFSTTDINDQWDGTFNDKKTTQGNYAWVLQYEGYKEDGSTFQETKTGTVLLLRE